MPRKKQRQSSASAGPPQIISAHFQPRERATSCWLRQEIRKVLVLLPFISTTGGWESKALAGAEEPVPGAPSPSLLRAAFIGTERICTSPNPAVPAAGTPAVAHAAGLEIPALSSAAAIFCCWLIFELFVGSDS